jgi:protein arginine kinase activator
MLCQECGKRPATLHYTKIVNGEKTEFHLCEVCAQEKGEHIPMMDSGFSIHQLLSGLLNFDTPYAEGGQAKSATQAGMLRCPTCGLTYTQFSKIGRLGCSDCYRAFGERLVPLFRRVHGNIAHRGKVPERTGGRLRVRREIERLKEQLQQCVAREAFEEAARLRDRIRTLQRKLEG